MCIYWWGTRTLSQGCTIVSLDRFSLVSHPLSSLISNCWICHWNSGKVTEAEWRLFSVIKEIGDTSSCPGAPQGPAQYPEWHYFILFLWLSSISLCKYTTFFFYPLICQWTFTLLPCGQLENLCLANISEAKYSLPDSGPPLWFSSIEEYISLTRDYSSQDF